MEEGKKKGEEVRGEAEGDWREGASMAICLWHKADLTKRTKLRVSKCKSM